MSYKITVYCDQASIKTTHVNIPSVGANYYGAYGSTSLNADGATVISGLNDSWGAKITATPATDCTFTKWEYWTGSANATHDDWTPEGDTNTFSYAGGADLYIRAHGAAAGGDSGGSSGGDSGGSGDRWYTKSTTDLGEIYESTHGPEAFYLNPRQAYFFKFKFQNSGKAKFYTTGSVDTYGYLCYESDFTPADGEPGDWIAENDDGAYGTNFSITYNVKANTTYYVLIRGVDLNEEGFVEFYIEPPGVTGDDRWSLVSNEIYTSLESSYQDFFSVGAYEMHRYKVTFQRTGTAYFYTAGDLDTYGYVTTSPGFDFANGEPLDSNATESDDNDVTGNKNFYISKVVTAGQTYYVWVRCPYSNRSGSTSLSIIAPNQWIISIGATFGTLDSVSKSKSIWLDKKYIQRHVVKFANSGTATFYTTGSLDTICYLTDSKEGFDAITGTIPSDSRLAYDNDNGSDVNFYLTYDVVPDKTYYVWVRGFEENGGDTTLHIIPPGAAAWTVSAGDLGTVDDKAAKIPNLAAKQLCRYTVKFNRSGAAKFLAYGSVELHGYLTTSTSYDTASGVPDSPVASDADGGDVSITCAVTKDAQYYLWIRGATGTEVSPISVEVVAPSGFSWTYEKVQGQPFNLTAQEWNTCTAWINTVRGRQTTPLVAYPFTTAVKDQPFTAAMYEEARLAIQAIAGYGGYIPEVKRDDPITAYALNILVSELGVIP